MWTARWVHRDAVLHRYSEVVYGDLTEKLYNSFGDLVRNQLLFACFWSSFASSYWSYSHSWRISAGHYGFFVVEKSYEYSIQIRVEGVTPTRIKYSFWYEIKIQTGYIPWLYSKTIWFSIDDIISENFRMLLELIFSQKIKRSKELIFPKQVIAKLLTT